MHNKVVIALDAMGGDKAPNIVIEGAELAISKDANLFFKIFGDAKVVLPLLEKTSKLKGNYNFVHTDKSIKGEDKPADALRSKDSSMRLAIDSVKKQEAAAVVSAGNTGALMAISRLVLGMIGGIDRPAITTFVPTRKDPCVLLDLGANAECTKEQLMQFAIMGDAFAKAVLGIKNPRVALLNIGAESLKGNDLVKSASDVMSEYKNINYVGFAEGGDIFSGDFDVIVADGFTGNVALKVLEGTVKFLVYKGRSITKGSFFSKIGMLFFVIFSFFSIKKIYEEINPKNYNGAMFIGLDGISVKSHGSADKKSFANAIIVAAKLAKGKVNEKIKEELISSHQ